MSDVRTAAAIPPAQSSPLLHTLTPLRGLAALWVILYHFTWQYFPQLNSEPFTRFIAKGYLAVDLFFLLSGFVLTHVYLAAFKNGLRAKDYRAFVAARIARIYPLHVFVLAAFVAAEFLFAHGRAAMPQDGPLSVTALLANLFMLQGLDAKQLSWNYPAWSISLEFAAYLVFPLVLPLLWHASKAMRAITILLLLGALVWLAAGTQDGLNQWSGPLALARCLPEFFLGSLAYALFRSGRLAGLLRGDGVLLLTGLLLGWTLHKGGPDLLAVPLFLMLMLAGASNQARAKALLNGRLPTWLGDVSYSAYLVHGFMLYAAGRLLPYLFSTVDPGELTFGQAATMSAAMLTTTLLVSHWTYRHVELRARRYWRERLGAAKPRGSRGKIRTVPREVYSSQPR